MTEKNKDRYIGPNKVFGITKIELKTAGGNDIVEIVYADNKNNEIMPLKSFELLSSDKSVDLTQLRNNKTEIIATELLKVINEHDIKYSEVQGIVQLLVHSVGDSFDRASNYAWTHDDSSYVPGTDFKAKRTLLDCHKIFTEIEKNKKEDGTEEQKN